MRRKGFTLVELAVVIVLMGIMAAFISISPLVARQTAKKEAERIAFFLNGKMRTADIRRYEFIVVFPEVNKKTRAFSIAWRCSDSETGNNIIKAEDNGKKYKYEQSSFDITPSCRIESPQDILEYHDFIYANVDDEDGISLSVTDSRNETYLVLVNKYGMVDTKE